MPPTSVLAITDPTARDLASAAGIWARATARRDDLDTPEPWERKLAGITARLASPGAVLFVATGSHGPTGFAVAAPEGPRGELSYLAVDPRAWGRGTAATLLAEVERWAATLGLDQLALWVLADNTRAHDVYARNGWVSTGERQHAAPSGRRERRLTLALAGRPTRSRS
ncbi:GNAT family N-acetyltransferase [Luteimicrobium sp. DT211]|uniref:GNAT family N-acetyltransferase n=1 Tax=Luteimicrobium sp. DT211 TaxID=3393412 RepID=UPI003CFB5F25